MAYTNDAEKGVLELIDCLADRILKNSFGECSLFSSKVRKRMRSRAFEVLLSSSNATASSETSNSNWKVLERLCDLIVSLRNSQLFAAAERIEGLIRDKKLQESSIALLDLLFKLHDSVGSTLVLPVSPDNQLYVVHGPHEYNPEVGRLLSPVYYSNCPPHLFYAPVSHPLAPPEIRYQDRFSEIFGDPNSQAIDIKTEAFNGSIDLEIQDKDEASSIDYWMDVAAMPPRRLYSWDTWGELTTKAEKPLAGVESIDDTQSLWSNYADLIELMSGTKLSRSAEVPDATLCEMARDCLIGIPSHAFHLDEVVLRVGDVYGHGITPPLLNNMLKPIAEAGSCFRMLRRWCKDCTPTSGKVRLSVCEVVEQFLDNYMHYIIFRNKNDNLNSFINETEDLRRCVVELEHCLRVCEDKRGLALITCLYDNTCMRSSVPLLRQMLTAVLLAAIKPYFDYIESWVLEGVLDDRTVEFGISCNDAALALRNSDFWKRGFYYSTRVHPDFISSFRQQVFTVGKSVNLLKKLCPKHFLFRAATEENMKISMRTTFNELKDVVVECERYRQTACKLAVKHSKKLKSKEQQAKMHKMEKIQNANQEKQKQYQALAALEEEAQKRDTENKKKLFEDLQHQVMDAKIRREDERVAEKEKQEEIDRQREEAEKIIDERRSELRSKYGKMSAAVELSEARAKWREKRLMLHDQRMSLWMNEQPTLEPLMESEVLHRKNLKNRMISHTKEEIDENMNLEDIDDNGNLPDDNRATMKAPVQENNANANKAGMKRKTVEEASNSIRTEHASAAIIKQKILQEEFGCQVTKTNKSTKLHIPNANMLEVAHSMDNLDDLSKSKSSDDLLSSEMSLAYLLSTSPRAQSIQSRMRTRSLSNLAERKESPESSPRSASSATNRFQWPAIRDEKGHEVLKFRGRHNCGHSSDSTIQKLICSDREEQTRANDKRKDTLSNLMQNYQSAVAVPKLRLIDLESVSELDNLPNDGSSSNKQMLVHCDFEDLPSTLQEAIAIPLNVQNQLVSKFLMGYFMVECRFLGHLEAIRDFILFRDGEFRLRLTTDLLNKRLTGKEVNPFELNGILAHALSCCCRGSSPFADNLSFYKNVIPKVGSLVDDANSVMLHYSVKWPNNIIVREKHMKSYGKVSALMLQLQSAIQALKIPYLAVDEVELRHIHGWRHEMYLWMITLQDYIGVHVLDCAWQRFNIQVNKARSLDELIKAHSTYVSWIVYGCLLDDGTSSLYERIKGLLNLCHRFGEQVRSIADDKGAALNTLRNTHERFHRHAKFTVSLLKSMLRRGCDPYLSELLLRLNFSDIYSQTAS